MSTERRQRDQLIDGHRHRALADLQTWRVLRDELGAVRAEEMLKRAQFAYGHTIGTGFKKYAPADLKGLCDAFLAALPDAGRPFDPEIAHLDSQRLEIRLHRSPYLRTWREAGVGENELGALSRIAAAMWAGIFKGAGFRFVGKHVHDGHGDVQILQIERTASSHSERHHDHPVGY